MDEIVVPDIRKAAARAGLPPGRERTSAGGKRVRTVGPDPHAANDPMSGPAPRG